MLALSHSSDAVTFNNRISGANALIGISAEANSQCTLLGNDLQQLQPLVVRGSGGATRG
jgi:hypothetical protein